VSADAFGLPLNDAAEPQPVDEDVSLAPTPPLRWNEAGSLIHEIRAGEQQIENQ